MIPLTSKEARSMRKHSKEKKKNKKEEEETMIHTNDIVLRE